MFHKIIGYGCASNEVWAAVWGHMLLISVHNRMCRYLLGVNKFTPNATVQGNMRVRVPW